MIYTSKENKKIKEIHKLLQKKYRDMSGLFLVEGSHLVEEAYKTNSLQTLILLETETYELPVETIVVSKEIMHFLSDMTSIPRVMGVCKKKSEEWKLGNHLLVLDGIQDPGNLGTIIRSAVAFSIDTIILSSNSVCQYNPKVIRSSQGMLFHQNILCTDLIPFLEQLKKENYKIIGTKVDGGTSLKHYSVPSKYAIIMGNEGNGVSPEVASCCEDFLYIPMSQECESLNVGVATSIILYELEKSE